MSESEIQKRWRELAEVRKTLPKMSLSFKAEDRTPETLEAFMEIWKRLSEFNKSIDKIITARGLRITYELRRERI